MKNLCSVEEIKEAFTLKQFIERKIENNMDKSKYKIIEDILRKNKYIGNKNEK